MNGEAEVRAEPVVDARAGAVNADETAPTGPTEAPQESPTGVATALEDSVRRLTAELAAEKDRGLRLQAEMANFRRRQEKDRQSWNQQSLKEAIAPFMEVMDNLSRANESAANSEKKDAEASLAALTAGVQMVLDQFEAVLIGKGAKIIDPKGQRFDPAFHQACGQIETDEVPEGHVALVFRRGCVLGEILVRTAMVQVAAKPGAAHNGAAADEKAQSG